MQFGGLGSGSADSPCPIPSSHGSPMQHQLRSVETASPLDKPPSDEQASDKTPRSKFDRGSVDDQPTGMIRHVSQRTHGASASQRQEETSFTQGDATLHWQGHTPTDQPVERRRDAQRRAKGHRHGICAKLGEREIRTASQIPPRGGPGRPRCPRVPIGTRSWVGGLSHAPLKTP